MIRKILLATDGREAAAGALRSAGALAERHGADVEVVSVMPPFPVAPNPLGEASAFTAPELERAALDALRKQVADQLASSSRPDAGWPLTVEVGPPAPTIVRQAQSSGASMIVLGLGRHALADRLLGTETALRVMRIAHVPVLAVPAHVRELPRQVVVAMDFSEYSHEAAGRALDVAAADAEVHLLHVAGMPSPDTHWLPSSEWFDAYRQRVGKQLEETGTALRATSGVRVQSHLLDGDPVREILRFAEGVEADLIAAGSHGAGFFGRVLMGSVSSRLVRGARCTVLVVPPREAPAELHEAR